MKVGAEGLVGVELLIDRSNQSRSVLLTHVRCQGLRAEDGRGGDRCDVPGLAIGRGHGLKRGFLAKDGTGAPAARSVLTIIAKAMDEIWRNPGIGLPARVSSRANAYYL